MSENTENKTPAPVVQPAPIEPPKPEPLATHHATATTAEPWTDIDVPPTPPGWPSDKAWREYHSARTARRSAEEAAEAAKAEAVRVRDEYEAKLSEANTRHARALAFHGLAGQHPQMSHPDVQAHFGSGYDRYAAGTAEPVPFAEWLAGPAKESPLYAAFYVSPQASGTAAPPRPTQNPNAGTTPESAPPGTAKYTPGKVQELKRAGKWTKEHSQALREQLAADGQAQFGRRR